MIQFLGKFHPLLVHLPIGIFLFGICLKVYEWYKQLKIESTVFRLLLLVNIFSSVLSILTGLVLFSGGDYDKDTVLFHRNLAIAFAIVSITLYFLVQTKWSVYLWLLGFILLVITGHLGGNLTHGEEYLSLETQKSTPSTIVNVQEAFIFEDVIKPILLEKCASCHSAKKQKGKLRLDEKDFLVKGGKNGTCINYQNLEESLLLQRIHLPESEEEHMPPKGKPQLTEEEIKIIAWWIKNGGDFNEKVKELTQTESERKALLTFQSGYERDMPESLIPSEEVEEPSKKDLEILTKAGVVILPIMQESNYLSVTIFEDNLGEKEVDALKKISENILIMNARRLKNKEIFRAIARFTNIKKLNLSEATLVDSDIQQFSNLKELQFLNLSGTAVTERGISFLKANTHLKKIYLFGSKFDTTKFKTVKLQFPQTDLDTGHYYISEADSLKFEISNSK